MHTVSKAFRSHYLITILSLVLFLGSGPRAVAQLVPQQETEAAEDPLAQFPEDSLGRRTPRGTVNGYIRAVANQEPMRASRYFNMREGIVDEEKAERLVESLQRLLDRGGNFMPYTWISNEPDGNSDDDLPPGLDRVGTVNIQGESIDLLVEQTTGPDGGPIWLFSSDTMESIASVSSEDILPVERLIPGFLEKRTWGGVSIAQWVITLLLIVVAYLLAWGIIWLIRFLIPKFWIKARTEPTAGIIKAFALPIRIYLAVWLFIILSQEIGLSILVRQRLSWITLVIGLFALMLLLWRLTDFIGNFSKRRMTMRGNVSAVSVVLFLRRTAKAAIIIFGIIAILGAIGVNVTTGLAALGIGGIALALGAQKTIENFVGSVTLITDQPVRVGDFCKVGDTVGTVESIGMRSTRIRTNDRTIVTIPNGEFSSTRIENYAHRDRFLFHTVLGVRYETTPDQVRYLLVKLREVLYAHPKVSPDPARVRFIGLGATSLNLEVWSYINAAGFDDFLEVREDLLLRLMDVVEKSGTDFAFPSQTLYFAKDQGISTEKSTQAEEEVRKWQEENEMQIPAFDPKEIERLKSSIKYPPPGSVKRKK